MSPAADPLRAAHRRAYGAGLILCLGLPSLLAVLLLGGWIRPGAQRPEGLFLQVGYLFTGLAFFSAAWVWARVGQVLRSFATAPEAARPSILLKEGLLWAGLLAISSLWGGAYWILVGQHAGRHAWGFILLTPALFLGLVPRLGRWRRALPGAGG